MLLRVMTYNIRGGLGMDGKRSLPRIADVVRDAAPDVVCLQEVHQRTGYGSMRDQARQMEQFLGMPVVFQRNLNLGFGGEGIAIATVLPVTLVQRHFLPSVRERRGALEVRLQADNGELTLFCTHWGLQEAEREQQARQLAALVNAAPRPTIVCGDLNARPEAASVQTLLYAADLQDADNNCTPTYPAPNPRTKLDYILCSPSLHVQSVKMIASSASDHCPVLAEIVVPHSVYRIYSPVTTL